MGYAQVREDLAGASLPGRSHFRHRPPVEHFGHRKRYARGRGGIAFKNTHFN